ncbi:MAG: hypothetical protein ABEI99_05030 [Halobaculum sp.]
MIRRFLFREDGWFTEESKLLAYIVFVLMTGWVVGQMVVTAFAGRDPLEVTILRLLSVVPLVSYPVVVAVVVGFCFGLVFLLVLDHKKRAQGVLFLVGGLIASGVALAEGVFGAATNPVLGVLALAVSLATARIVGRHPLTGVTFYDRSSGRYLVDNDGNPLEFPGAERLFALAVAGLLAVTVFEAHTTYPVPVAVDDGTVTVVSDVAEGFEFVGGDTQTAINLLSSGVFVGSVVGLLGYDASKRIVFIGPPRSGKTHAIIALYKAATESDYDVSPVSDYINEKRDTMTRSGEWIDTTDVDEVNEMGFRFVPNKYFRKNVFVDGLDYPGEYSYYIDEGLRLVNEGRLTLPSEPIDDLPDDANVGGGSIAEQLDNAPAVPNQWRHLVENEGVEEEYKQYIQNKGDQIADTANVSENRYYLDLVNSVLPRIVDADIAICTFDVEEQMAARDGKDTDHLGLHYYDDIVSELDTERVIALATKSDKLLDQFDANPRDDYEEFKLAVDDFLRSGEFQGPLRSLGVEAHPVYIKEEGDRPRRPLRTVGFEQLLERLGD